MEISALVGVSLKSKSSMRPERQLIQSVLSAAIKGEEGLTVAEYPAYRLRKPVESERLPASKYARAALLALKESREAMGLPALAQHYSRQYVNAARCPEFWMWCVLERELVRVVIKSGNLCIGLTEATKLGKRLPPRKEAPAPSRTPEPIGRRIDEKSLETLLANRPDLLEPGLTLFQRQCRIPVGIIDLLFVDRDRNYVVVEIKRPTADYREVVGQITTYMGWVRKNLARTGQNVKGIIVVGKKSERLEYSLDLVPDVSVRTFF